MRGSIFSRLLVTLQRLTEVSDAFVMEREYPFRSEVWNYFTKKDNFTATCNICNNEYSYKTTVSNLKKHFKRHKPDVPNDATEMSKDGSSDGEHEYPSRSEIWNYFTKKDHFTATCNICNNEYSYKTSTGNLKKHYNRHKPDVPSDATEMSNNESSDGEQEDLVIKGKFIPTWKYFDVLDSDKFEANCKLCGNNVPYETVSDLRRHIKEHGEKPMDSEDDENEVQLLETTAKKSNRKVSATWQFFKVVNHQRKVASCNFCNRVISYASSVSNLKKHLNRKHAHVNLKTNDDKDPIHMDTVYLEEYENSLDEQPKQLQTQRNTETPKKIETYSLKRNFQPKIQKEQVRSEQNTRNRYRSSSSEDEVPNKRRYTKTKRQMESLDYFGQYIISLLKELPKSVSYQLQGEIIKQIITSKVALQSQTVTNYAITINENHLNQSNQIITEPVTVTISQANEENDNSVVMVPESTENYETHKKE